MRSADVGLSYFKWEIGKKKYVSSNVKAYMYFKSKKGGNGMQISNGVETRTSI